MSSLLRTFSLSAIGSLLISELGSFASLTVPDIFGMISHRLEVERALELHCVAGRVLDRLAERIFVRLFRPRDRGAEHVGVERPACVDMGLAEIGVPLRVGLGEARRSGEDSQVQALLSLLSSSEYFFGMS